MKTKSSFRASKSERGNLIASRFVGDCHESNDSRNDDKVDNSLLIYLQSYDNL